MSISRKKWMMPMRTDITVSDDHRAVLVDGVFIELPDAIEKIAYIKKECEACKKERFLKCIQDDGVIRLAQCEMEEESKLFTQMGDAPSPQIEQLYREQYQKSQMVIEKPEPTPEPPKKTSFVNKILGRV